MKPLQAVLFGALSTTLFSTGMGRLCHADETPREAAAAHYARGVELANQGAYQAALEQFNDAYGISPHFAVLYNIGQAQIALGHPLEAIEALSKYLRDGAEQVPPSRREQVQAQLSLLDARIAELTIVTDTPGAIIRVDDHQVGTAPLPQPLRLVAGAHTVVATTAGGGEVTRTVLLGEAERRTLELALATVGPDRKPPPLAPQTAPPPPEPPAEAAPTEVLPPAAAPGRAGLAMRRLAYVLAGAGVLAGGGALGVYLWNRGRYQEWQRGDALLRDPMVGPNIRRRQIDIDNDLASTLTTANRVVLGLGIAGGTLLACSATLFLLGREERNRAGELSFAWGGWGGDAIASVAWRGRW